VELAQVGGSVSRNRALDQNEAVCGRDQAITRSPGRWRGGGAERRRGFLSVRGPGPVLVTMDAVAAGGGVHAEATFPEPQRKPATAVTAPTMEPLPAVKLQGVTIDQTVPLTGTTPETGK